MNSQPKISIIIPTYNRSHLIGRALKSVLNQTYRNFDIVVVDSSPDNKTEKAVENFNDKRIKYIHNEEKTILSAGKNQGIRASDPVSKYIAFLDDDDEFLPKFLEKTVKVLENKEDISVATCFWELRTRDGKTIRNDKYPQDYWQISLGSGSVIRKKIFVQENIWYDANLPFMEDADFGLRVLADHKLEQVPEVLRIYYIIPLPGETTMSSSVSIEAVDRFYQKNYPMYQKLGKKPMAYFYFTMGKMLIKAGAKKRGRKDLLNAFLLRPHPVYLLHYLLGVADIILPGIFKNAKLRKLKAKFLKGF